MKKKTINDTQWDLSKNLINKLMEDNDNKNTIISSVSLYTALLMLNEKEDTKDKIKGIFPSNEKDETVEFIKRSNIILNESKNNEPKDSKSNDIENKRCLKI